MEYIEIFKDDIPYEFEITLKNETFSLEINYNELYDFFTVDLYKNDKTIILGEKIVYGKPLFTSCTYKDVPKVIILPYDISENEDRVTFDNMNDNVFLYVVGDDDEILETES